MNSDSQYEGEETDTTSCMCGARSGLVGTFANHTDLSSAEGKLSRARYGAAEESENAHGVERFVCQGSHGADLSLYEIDVVLEEYGRIGVIWLCGGERCGSERRHGR